MQVALLGGSFNPPHVGHLMAAHYVRATQGVDEVWLMPTFLHPFGKVTAPYEHRVRMCELLCQDTSGWMKTSRVESEVGKEGRTVDTLEFLQARHPELFPTVTDVYRTLRNLRERLARDPAIRAFLAR